MKKYIILIVALGILLFQNCLITMSHDDFGYGSLSYGINSSTFPDIKVTGNQYGVVDAIRFLQWHYMNWGGRIPAFALLLFFLRIPIIIFKVMQTIVVFLIFFYLSRLNRKGEELYNDRVFLFLVASYLLIPLVVVRESSMWVTSSFVYLWTTILAIFLVFQFVNWRSKNRIKTFGMMVLFLLGGWSQELVSVILCSFCTAYLLLEFYIIKKVNFTRLAFTMSAAAGTLILMLAPGNKSRMMDSSSDWFYKQSFIIRTIKRAGIQIQQLYTLEHCYLLLFLIIPFAVLAYHNINKQKDFALIKMNVLTLQKTMPWILVLFSGIGVFLEFLNGGKNSLIIGIEGVVTVVVMLCIFFTVLMDYRKSKDPIIFSILIGICICYFSFIFVPASGERMFLPLYLFIPVLVLVVLKRCMLSISYKLLIPIIFVAVANYGTITSGYLNNYPIHMRNQSILHQSAIDIKNGIDMSAITLFRFDDRFCDSSPWGSSFYQVVWMKYYYEIPQTVQINYVVGK